jgi:hypothetical protein
MAVTIYRQAARILARTGRLAAALAVISTALSTMTVPAFAGTEVVRVASLGATGYEWISTPLYANAGDNLYIRFDRIPMDMVVRWVRCGYVSTQDARSRVGGQGVVIDASEGDGTWIVGTGFRAGTCVRIFARAAARLPDGSNRVYFPIEAYFDDHVHW